MTPSHLGTTAQQMIRDEKSGRDTAEDPFHKSHSARSLKQMASIEEFRAPTVRTMVG